MKKVDEEFAASGMKRHLIKAEFTDGHIEFVTPGDLEKLIASGTITRFLRSDGWTNIGSDTVRGAGGTYDGPERRKKK